MRLKVEAKTHETHGTQHQGKLKAAIKRCKERDKQLNHVKTKAESLVSELAETNKEHLVALEAKSLRHKLKTIVGVAAE